MAQTASVRTIFDDKPRDGLSGCGGRWRVALRTRRSPGQPEGRHATERDLPFQTKRLRSPASYLATAPQLMADYRVQTYHPLSGAGTESFASGWSCGEDREET
jgi:hypothetical protein